MFLNASFPPISHSALGQTLQIFHCIINTRPRSGSPSNSKVRLLQLCSAPGPACAGFLTWSRQRTPSSHTQNPFLSSCILCKRRGGKKTKIKRRTYRNEKLFNMKYKPKMYFTRQKVPKNKGHFCGAFPHSISMLSSALQTPHRCLQTQAALSCFTFTLIKNEKRLSCIPQNEVI